MHEKILSKEVTDFKTLQTYSLSKPRPAERVRLSPHAWTWNASLLSEITELIKSFTPLSTHFASSKCPTLVLPASQSSIAMTWRNRSQSIFHPKLSENSRSKIEHFNNFNAMTEIRDLESASQDRDIQCTIDPHRDNWDNSFMTRQFLDCDRSFSSGWNEFLIDRTELECWTVNYKRDWKRSHNGITDDPYLPMTGEQCSALSV